MGEHKTRLTSRVANDPGPYEPVEEYSLDYYYPEEDNND